MVRLARASLGCSRAAAHVLSACLVAAVAIAALPGAASAADEREAELVPQGAVLRVAAAMAQSEPLWTEEGPRDCIECHDQEKTLAILRTPHAMQGDSRTPFSRHGCETCHGPGLEHSEDETVPLDVLFGREHPTGPQNAVCLDCHQGGSRIHWSGSTHESRDVACASCHDPHALRDPMLVRDIRPETFVRRDQSETCFTCHPQVRAETHRISTHPLKEGRVQCTDCHNVHGTVSQTLLRQQTLNETCYQCHAEKRGPFLWEHQPARDDCTTCHVPHGSNHRPLLSARAPWLCQSCHDAVRHPGTAYTASGLPGPTPNRALLLKSCLNCHYEVHGSNHPSGVRFTR
jgi:DmsE family decaheme c-type cytochrome